MKVAFAENNVLGSNGLGETKGFTINASAHAFRILSSGMYSDKIRAVLREIGCNAWDAHVAAGHQRPFRVKLPNALDDQFYIQDWGLGLSHEEVMNLYTSYFTSTKQSSNDFTGAFGLGSKSPFSYTDSFSVVSTYGGKKRTYSLYLANTGSPQVSLMAEEDAEADWPSGMRVGFAVKPEHISEFQEKAQIVFQWFAVTPEMRGYAPIKPVTYRYTCADYGLKIEGEQGVVSVLIGNVSYPLDLGAVGVAAPDTEQTAGKLINYTSVMRGLVLYVPLGAVEMTPSREALQYDPKNVKVLKEALKLAAKRSARETVTALEAAAKGGWKERCEARKIIENMMGGSRWYFKRMADALGVDPALVPLLSKFVDEQSVLVPEKLLAKSAYYVIDKGYSGTRVSIHTRDTYGGQRVHVKPETAVLFGVVKRAQSRAKRAVDEGLYKQVLVITRYGKDHESTPVEIEDEGRAAAKEMGDIPLVHLSTLEPYDIAPGTQKKRKKKGWTPSLPIGVTFDCLVDMTEHELELKDVDPLFACKRTLSKWGNSSILMREFATTTEDDQEMAWGDWQRIWSQYRALDNKVQLPGAPKSHAVLSAAQIKSIALPTMGWRNAIAGVREYMARPELRDELRTKLKKSHILAAESLHDLRSGTWMTGLAWMLAEQEGVAVEGMLKKVSLLDAAHEMLTARRNYKKNPNRSVIPPAIEAYQSLTKALDMTNELASDVAAALSVEDADAAFCKRFPRSELIDFRILIQHHRDQALDTINFVLSKEV